MTPHDPTQAQADAPEPSTHDTRGHDADTTSSRRPSMHPHPFDPLAFLSGIVFMTVALPTLASPLDLPLPPAELWWPLLLVVAGLAVLASARPRRAAKPSGAEEEDPV
jgi:hypothetical protein